MPTHSQARHGRHNTRRWTRLLDRFNATGARTTPQSLRATLYGAATAAMLSAGGVFTPAAWAQTRGAETPRPAIENTPLPTNDGAPVAATDGMGGTAFRMVIGLVLVLALVLGIWQLMKRMQRRTTPGMGTSAKGVVDVVSTTPIGPTRFLHLVRVGGELILVGATEHSITAIARITADEATEAVASNPDAENLQSLFDQASRGTTSTTAGPDATASQPLVDRLRSITARR